MRLYNLAFYFCIFFILGVLVAGLKFNLLLICLLTLLGGILFLFIGFIKNKKEFFWLAGLFLSIILGSFYYLIWDKAQNKSVNIIFNQNIVFNGLVIADPERGNQQKLVIELEPPYQGNVLVKEKAYPSFNYGDGIKIEGVIKKPESQSYADYLAKNGIFGVVDYPKSELVVVNQGSKIKTLLFEIKQKFVANFQKILPQEKAAFLSGIILGERAEFSQELKDAMSKSGTTHLVALSGYNISIIVLALSGFLTCFFSRRLTFILTILTILGFTIMTGAEASVIRAAIMGFIALLAGQIGRARSIRNAIVLAAFIMIIFNPMVLNFDVGFQLSFLALIGIVYLEPTLRKILKINEDDGLLGWRKNFLTTTSAQLAVAPLLIINFSQFSLSSLLANVLILEAIPITMFLGFISGGIGFIFRPISFILGWFMNLILGYELWIIEVFAKFSLPIKWAGTEMAVIYYLILVGLVIWEKKRKFYINN